MSTCSTAPLPCTALARWPRNDGGGAVSGAAIALAAKNSLGAWLDSRFFSGKTGWLGCSAGGKSKFKLAMGLAGGEGPFASLSPPPAHPPAECTAETGSCFCPRNSLGDWFARCLCAGGTSSLGRSAGGKSKFTNALAAGQGMGASAVSRQGNAFPFGSTFTHPHAFEQMTRPRSSRRTRAGMVEMPTFAISAVVCAFIPTLLLALCHIDSHGIIKL
jgi:hypothetical protein